MGKQSLPRCVWSSPGAQAFSLALICFCFDPFFSEIGSGKTLAYLAPLVSRIHRSNHDEGYVGQLGRPRVIVLQPSLELVEQCYVRQLCTVWVGSVLVTSANIYLQSVLLCVLCSFKLVAMALKSCNFRPLKFAKGVKAVSSGWCAHDCICSSVWMPARRKEKKGMMRTQPVLILTVIAMLDLRRPGAPKHPRN